MIPSTDSHPLDWLYDRRFSWVMFLSRRRTMRRWWSPFTSDIRMIIWTNESAYLIATGLEGFIIFKHHYLLTADFMFWNLGGRLILILTFFGFSSTISLDWTSSKLSLEVSLESLLICLDLTLFKGILLLSDLLPASCLVDFWSDNPCE